MLERLLVALLAGGHVLLEGVPGPREDAHRSRRSRRSSAAASAASSSRPTWSRPTSSARASTGPTAAASTPSSAPCSRNFLLADEINRAPAKVQSALLEVMQEQQVTIGGADVPGPAAVPRARDAEPDRVRGHLPAARGPGRPLPDEDPRRLPDPGRGGRGRRPLAGPVAVVEKRLERRRPGALPPAGADVFVDRDVVGYAVALADATRRPERYGLDDARAVGRVRSQPARADRPRPLARARWRCCAAGATWSRTTCATSRPTCCATASCCATTRSARGSPPTTSSTACSEAVPEPERRAADAEPLAA